MIYLGGVSFPTDSSSSSSQGTELLDGLMEHPLLVSASASFKAIPERKISLLKNSGSGETQQSKLVYLFQREFATVNPALVDLVGTDEATTCVGLVIRNRKNGMTSVAHMDSARIVNFGLTQMLSLIVDQDLDTELDVHVVGAFEDVSTNHANSSSTLASHAKVGGYSFPLVTKIVEALHKRPEKFHIQTLFVLAHNTKKDSEGNAYPIFNGLVVETATGSVFPACFDRTSRCPDEIVRRIRVSTCFEDFSWNGKLLETYDTQTDRFKIAPCCWSRRQERLALAMQNLVDSEILLACSTSPSAEAPDFVENLRRQWDYMIEHPDWKETFPKTQPRVFQRTAAGDWAKEKEEAVFMDEAKEKNL